MEESGKRSWGEVMANAVIIGMVVVGTMMFVNLPGATNGEGMMSKIFIGFLGAIITVQIIPALVMVGAMVKGIAKSLRRQEKHAAVHETGADH